MNLCTFGLHQWGKWCIPDKFKMTAHYMVFGKRVSDTFDVIAQDRTCMRCGKYQVKELK